MTPDQAALLRKAQDAAQQLSRAEEFLKLAEQMIGKMLR